MSFIEFDAAGGRDPSDFTIGKQHAVFAFVIAVAAYCFPPLG